MKSKAHICTKRYRNLRHFTAYKFLKIIQLDKTPTSLSKDFRNPFLLFFVFFFPINPFSTYYSCFIVLRSSMHNYTCDKTHVVLRKSPKANASVLCSPSVMSVMPQWSRELTPAKSSFKGEEMDLTSWWEEPQSHTAKRSVYRDEKNVTPVLQSNTFYRHKERYGRILLNLAEDWQRRQCSIHFYLLDYYIKHSLHS